MDRTCKIWVLFLILILSTTCLPLMVVKPAFALPHFPYPTPEMESYTFVVSNYTVNYSIIKQTPSAGGEYTGYNLVVYENYPPFPIEISFYDGTQKVTGIAPTNGYSTSFVSTNYPTQITMTEVSNEPVPTSPTISPSDTVSPTVTPTSTGPRNPPHLEPIDYLLPIIVVLATIIALSIALIRRHKKQST
jgi:hypothetical protein